MKKQLYLILAVFAIAFQACEKPEPPRTKHERLVKYELTTFGDAMNFIVSYTDNNGEMQTQYNITPQWIYMYDGTTGDHVSLSASATALHAPVTIRIYVDGILWLTASDSTSQYPYASLSGNLP